MIVVILYYNAAIAVTVSKCSLLLASVQIEDLYEDFNVIKLPLLEHEVRGTPQVTKFSTYMTKKFNPEVDSFTLT